MSVKLKLGITTGALSLIIIMMFLFTWLTINKQKDDGLLINLAGRQRMLSQKMTKEILDFQASRVKSGAGDSKKSDGINNTMEVFAATLNGLLEGGKVPLGGDMKNTEFRQCGAAVDPVRAQLTEVNRLWQDFSQRMRSVLASPEGSDAHLDWIMQNNLALLKEMDSAVVMMQQQSENRVRTLLVEQIAGVVTGVVCMIVAVITIAGIISRLDQIEKCAAKLGSGDLTAVSGLNGRGELEKIGQDLDRMSGGLRSMFVDVAGTSNRLDEGASRLSSCSAEMKELSGDANGKAEAVTGGAEQVSRNMTTLSQAAAAANGRMREVAETAQHSAENITTVASATEEMSATVAEIAGNAEKARTITNTAVTNVANATKRVDELGQAAQEISKVIDVIVEIAEQTKLLALNATIEAARAGEAGKGFAVVASEVKELASQTNNATSDIRHKVEAMQNSTHNTISEIKGINAVITEINEIVVNIAGAVEEQSVATQDIAQNISSALDGVQRMKGTAVGVAKDMEHVSSQVVEAAESSRIVSHDIGSVKGSISSLSQASLKVQKESGDLAGMSSELKGLLGRFRI
ncbi:MAG: type IV pili methyl-accepting chemotaxis transducer N-terminal domain-containing protein [Deltaproteobacteria bacterium]|nr:type IV pili methyl-accepting chemotaxis transducer N-terminal domain-containing protein [Deltaproteobacteria bacterium]